MTTAILLLSARALRIELALVEETLLYGPRHRGEAILNTNIAFGRCFEVGYTIMLRQLLTLFPAYFSFINEVALISNQYLTDIIVSKFFNFKHPLPNIFKSFPVSHIIHYDDSVCTPIITSRQSSKSFLSCRIPYLQFNILSIHFYCLNFKVDANRIEEIVVEGVFLQINKQLISPFAGNYRQVITYSVSDEEAAFTDTTVADQKHFEKVVVGVHLILCRHFEYLLN